MTEADGTDAVAWRRNLRKAGDGILLATRDEGGWSVDRLGRGYRAELWDAAMAPDGSVGLLRGGALDNTLQSIRDGHRHSERIPGVIFLGGLLAYDGDSRPGVLGENPLEPPPSVAVPADRVRVDPAAGGRGAVG